MYFADLDRRSEERCFKDTESNTNAPGLAEYPYVKRSPKNDYFGFGSDGYLYDFVKRSPKNDYFGNGSEGVMYDFAKRRPQND